ncbi:MAG: BtrH N-terminal domain-containing protein [Actinobacteria bacterium]|nr:BtrH N-terminal domain-containing protein [Actinomycetota bacterium]
MRIVLDGVRPWRHDLAGCLHACLGTLLDHAGRRPLEVLGAGWRFYYRLGDLRAEEYYHPCPDGRSLVASVAPGQGISSRWHRPADAEQGWQQVREQVLAGVPVAVAVDNFELPFRPAYRDVHSNHLVVVYGFDDERGTVRVLDAIPPFFDGDLPLGVLAAARDSGNRSSHERDMFFADNPIGNRWLELVADGAPSAEPRSPAGYLAANLAALRAGASGNPDSSAGPNSGAGPNSSAQPNSDAEPDRGAEPNSYAGRDGIARFLTDMSDRLADGHSIADELFVVSGVALAGTAVHADWVGDTGRRLGLPGWPELARRLDRLAHHWSAVRILAALTRTGEVTPRRLRGRQVALLADLDHTLGELDLMLAAA